MFVSIAHYPLFPFTAATMYYSMGLILLDAVELNILMAGGLFYIFYHLHFIYKAVSICLSQAFTVGIQNYITAHYDY